MRWIPVFASVLVTAAAAAQSGGWQSGANPGRAPADADNDGVVTREEAQAFPRLSGDFDAAEMNAHRERMQVEMRAKADERWKAADTDADGAISLAEAEASMPRMAERFKTFDANADGKVSRDEMHNFRMKKKKHRD